MKWKCAWVIQRGKLNGWPQKTKTDGTAGWVRRKHYQEALLRGKAHEKRSQVETRRQEWSFLVSLEIAGVLSTQKEVMWNHCREIGPVSDWRLGQRASSFSSLHLCQLVLKPHKPHLLSHQASIGARGTMGEWRVLTLGPFLWTSPWGEQDLRCFGSSLRTFHWPQEDPASPGTSWDVSFSSLRKKWKS